MTQSLNTFIIRSAVFLALVFIIVVLLYPVLQNAFLSNIFINIIIILGLIIGIIYNFYHLSNLNKKFICLSNFNITNSIDVFSNLNGSDKNISLDLKKLDGRYVFKSTSIDRLIENSDMTLISIRETSRYLVGLLVFLGLLGTFWGLLKTIGSVGNVISGLGIDDTNVAGFFNSLKDGLNAPLEGMSIAFSSSLLGLAGSLILGLLDLNLGQAQNKFSQYFEKTLSSNASPDFTNKEDKPTTLAIQKIYDNLDNVVSALKKTSDNTDVSLIASGSEVEIALEAQEKLRDSNIDSRVISVPCYNLFDKQNQNYKNEVLGKDTFKISIEASSESGWKSVVGKDGITLGLSTFGKSAPYKKIFDHFGLNSENITKKIKAKL